LTVIVIGLSNLSLTRANYCHLPNYVAPCPGDKSTFLQFNATVSIAKRTG